MWKLTLFGPPKLERDGRPQPIPRRKTRALLAYLAVGRQRYSREALAAVFWPEYGERDGRADLSRTLSTLRTTMGADFLLTDRESVALNEQADLWVDVVAFRRHVDECRSQTTGEPGDAYRQKLVAAVDQYQADFLAGFTLADCPAFDEWQLLQTEALRRDLSWALDKLSHEYAARNELEQAILYAQRWVGLDPLHEPAQRQLISLYARNGQRSEAHRQYLACERLLAEELGVEPLPETRELYEQIRRGGTESPLDADHLQLPESEEGYALEQAAEPRQHLFVARSQELERLDHYLEQALAGNGRVVFITGGAGRGKTSLLAEFARRAQESHAELIVAGGSGNAFAGVGDPYLPFREVMEMLAGNRASGGQPRSEQARRLRGMLPQVTQAILEHGPQLLDVLVSAKALLARATAVAPPGASWLAALSAEVARRQQSPGTLEQTALFGQFTNLLHHLAQKHPLLITLDDLQWIDEASLGLLFHLGRRLAGRRILIVGAYRPDELAGGRDGEHHPLGQLLEEFKRQYGDVFIDLAAADQAEGMRFVNDLLDSEPNQLDTAFRQALFRRTGGHPLFIVELLRDMQRRGDLIQGEAGRWREGQELDWEAFPARVEAVIARRVDRLDDGLRAILNAAAVEGELFTAEVVARVLGVEERPLLRALSQQLDKQQRLVRERGEIKTEQGYLAAYQFSHALFQQYLYQQLSAGERRRLHGAVAAALATLYAADLDQVVVQLAYHYSAAAEWPAAALYHRRAGELAYQRASLPDAVRHYRASLTQWPQADIQGRADVLCTLGECLWMLGQHQEAIEVLQSSRDLFYKASDNQGAATAQRLLGRVYWEAGRVDEAGRCYWQALTDLEGEPESEVLGWALASMSNHHMHMGNYEESIRLGERALALARRLGVNALIIQCLCDLGSAISSKGEWEGVELEQESLKLALAANRPHDAGRAYLYIAEALIYLGRYEQARKLLEEAIAYTRRMQIMYVAEGAASMLAEIDQLTGRWSAAIAQLQPVRDSSNNEQLAGPSQSYVSLVLSRLYNDLGQAEEAHKLLTAALADPIKSLDPRVALLGEVARAEVLRGRAEAVVPVAREIVTLCEQSRYLFPNINMALLFVCRLPVVLDAPEHLRLARSARQQLERLDSQFNTPAIAACLAEGKGWLALVQRNGAEAAALMKQAAADWQVLGHPYDQARALSGLGQALAQVGDRDGAESATRQGMEMTNALEMELGDPDSN